MYTLRKILLSWLFMGIYLVRGHVSDWNLKRWTQHLCKCWYLYNNLHDCYEIVIYNLLLQSFVELFLHKLRKSNEAYLSIFIFEVYGTSLCLRIAKITIDCCGNWVKRRREGWKRWKDSLWSLSQIKKRHRSLLIDRTLKD